MLGDNYDDRIEAYDRVDRAYEIMGQEPPHYTDPEYRERFYYELERIERGE